jgi:hypothetical protein
MRSWYSLIVAKLEALLQLLSMSQGTKVGEMVMLGLAMGIERHDRQTNNRAVNMKRLVSICDFYCPYDGFSSYYHFL